MLEYKTYNFFPTEKENLIESQTNNLALLEKLKVDYQEKEEQVNAIQKVA